MKICGVVIVQRYPISYSRENYNVYRGILGLPFQGNVMIGLIVTWFIGRMSKYR